MFLNQMIKMCALAVCMSCSPVGGQVAPALFMGAALGGILISSIAPPVSFSLAWQVLVLQHSVAVLLGAAGAVAGSTRWVLCTARLAARRSLTPIYCLFMFIRSELH